MNKESPGASFEPERKRILSELNQGACRVTIVNKNLTIHTAGKDDVIDITSKAEALILDSKIKNGIITLFVSGSTASVTTIEYESGLVKDIKDLGERIAPSKMEYAHNAAWGDGNGQSHLRAAVIGPSLVVPIVDGKMTLGTWQQVVVIDHDNRARSRDVVVQIMGE